MILSLVPKFANVFNWQKIASICAGNPFVVGYDLINEPYTPHDNSAHWSRPDPEGINDVLDQYTQMVKAC
jgi:hypothetical protein